MYALYEISNLPINFIPTPKVLIYTKVGFRPSIHNINYLL